MTTLLMRLAGPMQSWGSRSRFATRGTEPVPTKSGVVGLLAAALGIPRDGSLERFTALMFGVRVERSGRIERDFQTARTLDGSHSMPLSHRYYLADAVFLVGMESGDRALLESFVEALRRPAFPLYLGRRAFPPAGPIELSLHEQNLGEVLHEVPWSVTEDYQKRHMEENRDLELWLETDSGDPRAEPIRDLPMSFDPRRREYGWRSVQRQWIPNPSFQGEPLPPPLAGPIEHEPIEVLPKEE